MAHRARSCEFTHAGRARLEIGAVHPPVGIHHAKIFAGEKRLVPIVLAAGQTVTLQVKNIRARLQTRSRHGFGHRAVIAQVRKRAVELECASVVVTFDRHPAAVVRPESAPKLLTDLDQKLELLESTGIDAVYVVRFDAERAAESPTQFIERALVGDLRAREVIVGEDFHFGHKRAGNVALLREVGASHDFSVSPIALIARPDGVAEPADADDIHHDHANRIRESRGEFP